MVGETQRKGRLLYETLFCTCQGPACWNLVNSANWHHGSWWRRTRRRSKRSSRRHSGYTTRKVRNKKEATIAQSANFEPSGQVPISSFFNVCIAGNGYISTDTLKEILRELDNKLSEADLENIIEEVDEDGSGTLDFDGKKKCQQQCNLHSLRHKSGGRQNQINRVCRGQIDLIEKGRRRGGGKKREGGKLFVT